MLPSGCSAGYTGFMEKLKKPSWLNTRPRTGGADVDIEHALIPMTDLPEVDFVLVRIPCEYYIFSRAREQRMYVMIHNGKPTVSVTRWRGLEMLSQFCRLLDARIDVRSGWESAGRPLANVEHLPETTHLNTLARLTGPSASERLERVYQTRLGPLLTA